MSLSSRVIKGGRTAESHQVPLRLVITAVDSEEADRQPGPEELLARAGSEAENLLARAGEEARETLAIAARQADELRQKAAGEAGALREEARQEGYAAGQAQAEEAQADLLAKAVRHLDQAQAERLVLLEGVRDEVIELAVTIAHQVVARELSMAPAAVMAIAREALELVSNRERVTVYVNPSEADLFRARRGDLEGSLSDRALLVIIADQEVSPGGVRVETEQGLVDASLEARFATMSGVMKGRRNE
ncbi:MAG TPA: FliH/SctL family protein [Spirochaetia bacterium]|nr:FliH/SctL family protein [Spirochaetia bacterium]